MHIEVVTDIDRFRDMRTEWNHLFYSMATHPLPLSHEWLFIWWQIFGSQNKLHIICVYDGGRLVAIAPFVKEKTKYRGISVSCLRLMANGHTPFCDLIIGGDIALDQKRQILELIINSNTEDMLVFGKVLEDGFMYQNLITGQNIFGYRYGAKAGLVTPIIPINGKWEEFLKGKSRKFRKNINNKFNRFKKEIDFTIDCIEITSREHPALKEMVEISKNSWKTKVKNDLGSKPGSKEFLFMLADKFGDSGSVHLWIIRKAGNPVAYEFHLDFDGVVYPLRADFNEKFRDYSPGSILEYTTLKVLFEEGAVREYYSCADDYWYLHNWTTESKKQFNIEIFANNWKSRALYMLEYVIIPRMRIIRDKFKGVG